MQTVSGSGAQHQDDVWSVSDRHQSLQDIVYDKLQSDIALGAYQIGEKLGVRELSRTFNISSAPLREALMRLVTDGLVTFKPRVGFFVSSFEPDEISEIFEIRLALECLACEKAVILRNENDLADIEELLFKLDGIDADNWHLANREFHLAIYRSCGSPRLMQEIIRYWDLLSVYLRLYMRWFKYPVNAQQQHRQMLEALRNRDAETLKAELKPHLFTTRDRILKRIAQVNVDKSKS